MAAANRLIDAVFTQLRRRHAGTTLLAVALAGLLPALVLLFTQSSVQTVPFALLVLALPLLAAGAAGAYAWQEADRQLTRWLDDHIAALQDSSFLLQTDAAVSPLAALQRQRIEHELLAQREGLATILPPVLPRSAYFISALVAGLLLLLQQWPVPSSITPTVATAASPDLVVPVVSLTVTPPVYTGLPAFVASTGDVQVPDGSRVEFCLAATSSAAFDAVVVQWLDGEERLLQPTAEPAAADSVSFRRCTHWSFSYSTGFRVLRAGELLPGLHGKLLLQADQAPVITIRQPARDVQEVDSSQYVLPLDLQIEDDYGVVRASLHWTLARGGGENVRFTDREQRLPAGVEPRRWLHEQMVRLRDVGMEPGDELYFYLTAEDNRTPARQQSRTRTYILRHPVELGTEEGGARLPADLGKAKFRSQRQIILDTEALISQRKTLPEKAFRERSEKLAQDQMILRLRYGEFLGEESSFEAASTESADADHQDASHQEAGHDEHDAGPAPVGIAARAQLNVLSAYGHAHDEAENATLFDEATKTVLRRALRSMWSAEGGLRMSTPEAALPHEYAALAAIKELQQAERMYLHKTSFSPPPMEESMRFSGEATDLRSLQRQHQPADSALQQMLRRVIAALDASTATPATLAGDLASLRQSLQDNLRQPANADAALTSLSLLQEWQSGCSACRVQLRDQLLPALGTPLPALHAPAARHESLRRLLEPLAQDKVSPQ